MNIKEGRKEGRMTREEGRNMVYMIHILPSLPSDVIGRRNGIYNIYIYIYIYI